MKSTDENLQASRPEFPRQISSPGKLVGLNAGQRHDRAPVRKPVGSDDPANRYRLDRIVIEFDLQINVATQQPAFGYVPGQTGKASKRVAWEYAAEMADHVSFIIVFGRFYEDDANLLPFESEYCRAIFHDLTGSLCVIFRCMVRPRMCGFQPGQNPFTEVLHNSGGGPQTRPQISRMLRNRRQFIRQIPLSGSKLQAPGFAGGIVTCDGFLGGSSILLFFRDIGDAGLAEKKPGPMGR